MSLEEPKMPKSGYEKIFIDMDGVLSDFNKHFKNRHGVLPSEYEAENDSDLFWEAVYEEPRFFETMPIMSNAKKLWNFCQRLAKGNVVILSSPSRVNSQLCVLQKRTWIDRHIGYDTPAIFESNKAKYAGSGRLLIDDTPKKIDAWRKAGGIGCLYKDYDSAIKYIVEHNPVDKD